MTRSLHILIIALLTAGLWGCAEQRAPTDAAHPAGWVLAHGAQADENPGSCTTCHGAELAGGTSGVACLDCHLDGPPFALHSTTWDPQNTVAEHQSFAESFSWAGSGCATDECHGPTLAGGTTAGAVSGPSCFADDFTNGGGQASGCHRDGPPAPHDEPYLSPAEHGPQGRDRQRYCRNCHGLPANTFDGGFVADPEILANSFGNCSNTACHPAASAHPTNWQGSNDPDPSYSASHRRVAPEAVTESCALCHDTEAVGAGPLPGAPSCFSSGFTNADGSTTGCHADGPGSVPHELPFTDPNLHGPDAKESGFDFCQQCHGTPGTTGFDGGIADVACSQTACHPDAGSHPTSWQGNNDDSLDYISSHQTVLLDTTDTSCGICHNTTDAGAGPEPDAPSCFSTSHTNANGQTSGCHSEGPGTPTHELPYASPAAHGPTAKGDGSLESGQGFCQTCHGTPGTTVFDGGVTEVGCSQASCHPDARAHPTNWQGSNDDTPTYLSTHRTSGDFDSCTICHNTAEDAPGPLEGAPSCFSTDHTNANGITSSCHSSGPGAPHALGPDWLTPSAHGAQGKQELAYCQECHGTPGAPAFDGGIASTACSQVDCHPSAGAHPTSWQGTNDSTPEYVSSHRTAGDLTTSCVICHDGPAEPGVGPEPNSPSCFSTQHTNGDGILSGCHPTGPGAGHSLPFASASLHGTEAKNDLKYCQQCHADPFNGGPGSNPGFTVPLGNLAAGCEDCHTTNTAHPAPWLSSPTRFASHRQFGNKENACTLCHGADLLGTAEGGVGPACETCHTQGLPIQLPGGAPALTDCSSCHSVPPDTSSVLVADRPNRDGAHTTHDGLAKVTGVCGTCHDGAGTDTPLHFDDVEPADVALLSVYDGKQGAGTRNPDGSCANVSCHGGQQTPVWLTEVLDPDTQCATCHELGSAAGAPEANSYFSGNHGTHAETGGHAEGQGFDPTCGACHDATALATDHFAGLDTPEFEGDPVATLRAELGYDNAVSPATCTNTVAGCHQGEIREWGGAGHIVGAQWLLPTEHADSAIAGSPDCFACHTNTAAGGGVAPACQDCHLLSVPINDTTRCDSCHTFSANNTSPPTGSVRPNRLGGSEQNHTKPGDHDTGVCNDCHTGAGTGSLDHFDESAPPNITPPADEGITFDQSGTQVTCNGSCHGKDHESERWY